MVAVNAFEACKIGDIETIRKLPRCDPSLVDQNGASCLHYAARGGSLAVVEHLVTSLGFSVQARTKTGATALHDAAARGNTAVVKWLIESGGLGVSDQDEGGVTALHLAARYSHFLTVEWLLDEANADASVRSNEGALPLHFAVVGGDMNCVNILVDENPRLINMQMNNGATPIYLASQTGNLDVLKYLVDHKGATKIKAYDAMSCLHAAAQKGHLSVVKWLVKVEKCNPNERDFDGATPLHFAASRGHADVVRWLLKEGGARVTLDNLGGSPLHSSAEHGELLCIQALLDCGCDVTYTDNEGLTAAELADNCDQTEAAALIRGELTLAKLGIHGFTSPEINHNQNSPTQQHTSHPPQKDHIATQPYKAGSTSPQSTPHSAITTATSSSATRHHISAPAPLTSGYRGYSPTTKHKEVVTTSGYGRGFVNHAEKSSITRTVSRISVDSSASNFGVFEDRDVGVQHVVVAEIHKTPKVVPQTPRPVTSQRPPGHDSLNSTQESIVFSTSSSSFSQDESPLDPDRRPSVQKTVNFFTDSLDRSETPHRRQQAVHPSPPHTSSSGSSQRTTSATSSVSFLTDSPDSSNNSNTEPSPNSQKQDSPKNVTKFQYYSTPYKKDFNTVTKSSFAKAKALFQLNKVDGPEICPDSGEICTKSEREHYQPNQRSSSSKMEAHEISKHGKNSGQSSESNGSHTASSISTQPAQGTAKSVITIHGGHAMIVNSTSGNHDNTDKQHSTKPPQQQARGGVTAVQMQKDIMMKELQLKNRNSEHIGTAPSAPALVNGHAGSNHQLPHKANPASLNLAVNGGDAKPGYRSENAKSFSRSSSESSTSSQVLSPVESKHNLIADIQSVVSGASSLSLRRTLSKGEGVSMVYQSKKGASQGETKNDSMSLNGRFDPKNFMDKVEKVDSSGRAIPEWRRQVLARHLAEKTQNEFEDKKLAEDYEARFKDMPVWKRALIEKREAQSRDAEAAGNKK